MEFASVNFILFFLPIAFLLHLVLPKRWKDARNWLLIVFSLLFYAWGELKYVILMLVSSGVNFGLALWLDRLKRKKWLLVTAVIFNIGLLAVFKYADFFIETLNGILGTGFKGPGIVSPLGISFFTFQSLSYIIDTYRGDIKPTKNPGKFLLYISFFAQLLQGPIIRWKELENELGERRLTVEGVSDGLRLFVIGLAMKLILANTLSRVSGYVYGLSAERLNALSSWVGAFAFLLQLYFDFAGYSTMAVGLGKMFGFSIPQNFNYPYIACSMTEFWRRWHITLSRWFRDYVYIPLGGNRKGAFRTGLNKVIVFLLTGLWHGANWTFVVWGAYNGAFLLGESFLKKTRFRLPQIVTWLYTITVVTVGFAIFNSPDMAYAWAMVKSMFTGFSVGAETVAGLSKVFRPTVIAVSAVSLLAATPLSSIMMKKLECRPKLHTIIRFGSAALLFVLCMFYLASGSFSPSIYTKF